MTEDTQPQPKKEPPLYPHGHPLHGVAKYAMQYAMRRKDLSSDHAHEAFEEIMHGDVAPEITTALLAALAAKGESSSELYGATHAMRQFAIKVHLKNKKNVIDTCGTGGDGAKTFNISTAAALVVAASDTAVKVAKHGNRAYSGKSGSADVLEHLGINIQLTPEQIAQSIEEVGIGFMYAPNHHPAVKHASKARKLLEWPTIFNLMGPLANPAGVTRQLIGAYSREAARLISRSLVFSAAEHALVVHSIEGIDEISTKNITEAVEVKNGRFRQFRIDPRDFSDIMKGYKPNDKVRLKPKFKNAEENARTTALSASRFQSKDTVSAFVALNAGAALYISGIGLKTIKDGVALAVETMHKGTAAAKLEQWKQFTNQFKQDS